MRPGSRARHRAEAAALLVHPGGLQPRGRSSACRRRPAAWPASAGPAQPGPRRRQTVQNSPMCQLLGMNCNTPTDVTFSFTGFAQRGGRTDHHADGWGIAFFEGAGLRHFVDHQPACDSPVAELIRRYPIKSRNVIAHIRKATQGAVALQNCHPFVRELWGRYWVFAHNGNLKDFHPRLHAQLPARGQHRQRARLLLADAGTGQVACRRAQRAGADADAARTDAARSPGTALSTSCCPTARPCGRIAPPTCSSWSASTRSRMPSWPMRT